MKRIIFYVVTVLFSNLGFAQTKNSDSGKWGQVPQSGYFVKPSDSTSFMRYDGSKVIDIRTATSEQLRRIGERDRLYQLTTDRFWGIYSNAGKDTFPRRSLALRFQENTGAKIYDGLRWTWGTLMKPRILISGQSDVEVIDVLVTPQNAANYRYRVVQNDNKELVGWSIPNNFRKTTDGKQSFSFLGNIQYQSGQFIMVEIYNIHNYRDRDAIIIDWREPRAFEFWTSVEFKAKNFPLVLISESLGKDRRSTNKKFIETDTLKNVKIRLGDSLVKMTFRSHHLPTPYHYKINFKRKVDGKVETIDLGQATGSFFLDKEYWNKPGEYEITFTPELKSVGGQKTFLLNDKQSSYKFSVLPDLNPKLSLTKREIILLILAILPVFFLLAMIIFTLLKRRNDRKLNAIKQQKEMLKLQMNSIRSQLNPHFMYNAMAGIQSLINTNKIEEANKYLSKFARITRNVLNNEELISLKDERDLLQDYLEMEQFRFGFQFEIIADDSLVLDNIEIPSMLLQPYVENAVKHGVAEAAKSGLIRIELLKQGDDLILRVFDNGKGFDVSANYSGFGLKLSDNRITLLNSTYPENDILLFKESSEAGTKIEIKLTHWL